MQVEDLRLVTAPKAKLSNLVTQKIKDEMLVYNLETNQAYCLNQTAFLVWDECDGTNTIESISQKLNGHYQQTFPPDLVVLTIYELKKRGLIENNFNETANTTSRRELVKKVGLMTAIALPAISSVVAPSAVMAQSRLPFGASCSSDSQCNSGNCSNFSPSVCCFASGGAQPGTVYDCLLANFCSATGANVCCRLGQASGNSCATPFGVPGVECICG